MVGVRLDAELIQAEIGRDRLAAHGQDEPLGFKRRAVLEQDPGRAVRGGLDRLDRRAHPHVRAAVARAPAIASPMAGGSALSSRGADSITVTAAPNPV